MTTPTITVTPSMTPGGAAGAYGRTDAGRPGGFEGAGNSFGGALDRALQGVIDAGHQADAQAMTAIAGGGNLTEMVSAVSRAELAMQTTVAIRDRVVQAYQDIMRMPI